MNPFSGMIGDYAAIMGNTGGDNRVEFGTRLNNSIWYESPHLVHGIFSFDLLFAPGRTAPTTTWCNRRARRIATAATIPGSGNLPLSCDDGAFGTAYSADLKFEFGRLLCHGGLGTAPGRQPQQRRHRLEQPGLRRAARRLQQLRPRLGNTRLQRLQRLSRRVRTGVRHRQRLHAGVCHRRGERVGVQGRNCSTRFDFGLSISGDLRVHERDPCRAICSSRMSAPGTAGGSARPRTSAAPTTSASAGRMRERTPGDPAGQHNYDPVAGPDYANM